MIEADGKALEGCVRCSGDDVRILHRLNLETGPTGEGDDTARGLGLVIDVETEGLDKERDAVIELAMRRFAFDADGVIFKIDRSYSWRQDPGRPLTPEIADLTGLTDADLSGQSIDEGLAIALLRSANVIIAHNAQFDRPFVEKRLPLAQGFAWACSCQQVDWRRRGFDGRSLGFLLSQAGYFHGAHRAEADVDATIAMLCTRGVDNRTALAELLETAQRPTWKVRARGAHFDVKDRLRLRGYRWHAGEKVWWREIADGTLTEEEFWLAENVYSLSSRPGAAGPEVEPVDWYGRYSSPDRG